MTTTRHRRALAAVVLLTLVLTGSRVGAQDEAAPPPVPRAGVASPTTSVFVPVWPCRLVNTQNSAGPLAAGEERFYRMHGNTAAQGGAAACGIPQRATALEVSVTAVSAAGDGYLRMGSVQQALPTATFLNYSELMNTTNTGTVQVSSNAQSSFRVQAFVHATHVVVDVFGYYTSAPFAAVADDGQLTAGNGVVATELSPVIDGWYVVRFDRDLSGCAFAATPDINGEPATVTVSHGIQPTSVIVRTYDDAGDEADVAFHLTASC